MMICWKEFIKGEKLKPYYDNLLKNIKKEEKNNLIFPQKKLIFKAFKLTPFNNVKIVIIGQDPYHNLNQANGLAFSINANLPLPPSLRNIFIELEKDLGIKRNNGNLSDWAEQGVLLLNTILTVSKNKPLSHKNFGWEKFTNHIIKILDEKIQPIFVLWGNYSQDKTKFIKNSLIIKSSHPSPFSAHISFFNSKPFSRINQILKSKKQKEISW